MRRRTLLLFLGVVGLAALGITLNTLIAAGVFRSIQPHFAGKCLAVPLPGAEDISFDQRNGLAYISSFDRRAAGANSNGTAGAQAGKLRGDIYSYNPNAAQSPVNLTASFDKPFQPHGLGLYVAPDGSVTVMAVNHAGGTHTIEIFDLRDGQLRHRRTVADPLISSPNDVAPTGPDSFYVSNDHGYGPGIMRTIEDYLRLRASTVAYFDGAGARYVIKGLVYANGVALSRDGSRLYVAETTGRRVNAYARDARTGDLVKVGGIEAETGVDNIELDQQGALWIGAHPKMLAFVAHAGDAKALSPSQVLKLTPQGDGSFHAEEIYLNDGGEISGSSVAAVSGKKLLIGPVFAPHFLNCDLP